MDFENDMFIEFSSSSSDEDSLTFSPKNGDEWYFHNLHCLPSRIRFNVEKSEIEKNKEKYSHQICDCKF